MSEKLSYSRAYTHQKCKKLYDFQYLQRLKPLSKMVHTESWLRMMSGVSIHAALESCFLGEPMQAGLDEVMQEQKNLQGIDADKLKLLLEMQSECIQVASDFASWLPVSDWEPLTHNGKPMVEAELSAPIAGWGAFTGYADLVARHIPTGRVLVLDYKTRNKFYAEGDDVYSQQFALYQYALKHMGIACDGSLLCEIKPEVPKSVRRKPTPDPGGIDGSRLSADGRFRTECTYRSETYINQVWADFEKQALVMAAFDPARDSYTNMSAFNCKTCPYLKLCQAELQGAALDDLRHDCYTWPGKQALNVIL